MFSEEEIWELFSAKSEYESVLTDAYGRHPYWAAKHRNVFDPVVSRYLVHHGFKPLYPDNKNFALCVSHDIDLLFDVRTKSQLLKAGLKNTLGLKLGKAGKDFKNVIRPSIEYNFHIDRTLEHGKKYGVRSSFYFLSLNSDEQDYNYSLSEIGSIFDLVKKNDGEIGLHGGHQAYGEVEKMIQEKTKLEKASGVKVSGYRNHYLRFETPLTWQLLNKAGFSYDSTFGYADCVGFRNGTCHPFQPFDLKNSNFTDLIELPLIIMDRSLSTYMNLARQKQFEMCKMLIDIVAENRGVLTLLWHNNFMTGADGEMYAAILKYAFEKNAWMATGKEITDFWRENGYHDKMNELLLKTKRQ
ncbi:MAG TPA: polysaccharide deacetylase family protein [Flavobacteriales bacterium]|nr:polysaccharide deacetylase family protein [Flavobacteriales bacterium]